MAGDLRCGAVSKNRNKSGTQKQCDKHMKKHTNASPVIRSSLALALAMAIWSPVQAQPFEPTNDKMMMDETSTGDHKEHQEELK
jgi:hypothetical protein